MGSQDLRALTVLAEQGHAEHQEGGGELHGGLEFSGRAWVQRCFPESGLVGFIYPIPCPSPGLGITHPVLRKVLFAQLVGRTLANFLLRLVGPGKPMPPTLPGSQDFLLAGPSVNAGTKLCFVCPRPTQASALPGCFLA